MMMCADFVENKIQNLSVLSVKAQNIAQKNVKNLIGMFTNTN
jgi:hypothetical protein